mgnify:CR=1
MYPWGDERRFNSYARHFRELFGERIQKVAVHAGFTCPNRDGTLGTGGCTFCNNEAFTPSYCKPAKSIRQQIDEGIEFHLRRYRKASRYLVYFQSYSNTYAPVERLETVWSEALSHPQVAGIVVGTRPDCVDEEKLDLLARVGRDRYTAIEYGIESTSDETLRAIHRGHDFACTERAVRMTAERGIPCGGHFILGLPGESEQAMIDQTQVINELPLTTIKFHQLQIFRGTALADEYASHPERFLFWERDAYIDFFISILRRLRPDLVVERFAGEAPPRFLAKPSWGLVRNEQLLAQLEQQLEELDVRQGDLYLRNRK